MEFPRQLVFATLLAGTLAMPVLAQSQYFVSGNLIITSVTCDQNGASGVAEGTQNYNLPDSSPNVIFSIAVYGDAAGEDFNTLPGPFPTSQNVPAGTPLFNPLPSATVLPWTSVLTLFPSVNGAATGIGSQHTTTCAADGSGTMIWQDGISASGPTAVPTLPIAGLALLAMLLSSVVALNLPGVRRAVE
jgi:hypothetical protein